MANLKFKVGGTWSSIPAIKGDKGDNFVIAGTYATLGDLQTAYPTGSTYAFAVGSTDQYDIYIWDVNTLAWTSIGSFSSTVIAGDVTFTPYGDIASTNVQNAIQELDDEKVSTSDIGVTVEPYDATILKDSDIGVTVEAYDATILKDADIGVTVQGYDATLLNDADIGVNVQAYSADNAESFEFTATIPSTSWTGSSAPYSKAVTVTGILSTDRPIIDLVLTGTYATDQTMREDWANVYRAVTSTDTVTFYADVVPSADISIQLVVVR